MAVLSTASTNSKPWGAAIIYTSDEDFNFFFMTRVGTLKYKNLEANPEAAITIADEENQTTVQAAGKISKVATKDMIDVVFKKLAHVKPHSGFQWTPPVIKVHKGDYMVLRLTPTKLQYANYKQTKSDVHDEYIENIISS